jgi:iron complex outermembrane recepter protein
MRARHLDDGSSVDPALTRGEPRFSLNALLGRSRWSLLGAPSGRRLVRANRRMSRRKLIAACGGLFLPAAVSSFAQQDTEALRSTIRVDVTGSNLRRIDGESGLPLQIMTREELQHGGVQNLQDLLDRISANQSFGGFNEAMGIGNTLVGFTSASLRGLGAERTLILLNGRRLAPYALSGGQSVDLSGIPVSALEKVEILKDGASAIYGTDAIGGVINFVLRKDFSGVEVNANYFDTQHGGGNHARVSATAGYGDLSKDRYNVFISADYVKQYPLKASQRDFSKTWYLPSIGVDRTQSTSVPANFAQDLENFHNPTIPFPAGATPRSCLPPTSFATATNPFRCQFDPASVVDALPEAEKTNLVGRFTWQLDAAHQFFADTTYYHGIFKQRTAPTPVFPYPFVNNDNSLPPTSPYYPTAYVAGLPGGDPNLPLNLLYRTLELGPRVYGAKVDQWTVVGGLSGTVRAWDYTLALQWVSNQERSYLNGGYISDQRFNTLLHSGIVNPFGPNTDTVVESMRATQITGLANDNRASNYGVDFKASRNVLDLPAGPVALALGVEGRRESLRQTNSDFVIEGDVIGNAQVPSLTGTYRTVWAAFGEVNIPIVKSLEANVAVRHDHYGDFGSTTNPKVAVRWQPSQNLLLRAAYGTGFRAPTLSDLFQPPGMEFADSPDDPIRCPITRADSDCRATSNYPIPYRAHTGGNPLLEPETSRQWSAGVVWQPAPQFSASADYYRVELRNLISFAPSSTVFDNFAALGSTQVVRKPPDVSYPDLPGQIDYVIEQPINLGTLHTSGVDIELKYRSPVASIGRFTAGLAGTYVIDYALTDLNSQEFPASVGSRGPIGAISRWRHYATLDWTLGPWGATLANTFQNGYVEPFSMSDPTGCSVRRVGNYSVWDVQGRYTGMKNTTLTAGIRNLMDAAPPQSNQFGAFQVNYDPSYANPLGRTFYGAIRYAFQ